MARQHLPARINHRAKSLRHAKDHATRQRAPQVAKPADDHRFKAEYQTPRPDERLKVRPYRQKHPGNRHNGQAQRHRHAVDMRAVQPDHLGDFGIIRSGAKGAAKGGAVEQVSSRPQKK